MFHSGTSQSEIINYYYLCYLKEKYPIDFKEHWIRPKGLIWDLVYSWTLSDPLHIDDLTYLEIMNEIGQGYTFNAFSSWKYNEKFHLCFDQSSGHFLKSFLGLYYALYFIILLIIICTSVRYFWSSRDNCEYYMLIKEDAFIVMQMTMTLSFKIRETDKNRRA